MNCSDLPMLRLKKRGLPETLIERNALHETIRKGEFTCKRRNSVSCRICCQFTKAHFKDIPQDNTFADRLRNDHASCNILPGLLGIIPERVMLSGVPDKGLGFSEAVCTVLSAKPDERLILQPITLNGLADNLLVDVEVFFVMLHMAINELGKLADDVHIGLFFHSYHSNPISCFLDFEGGFFSVGCCAAERSWSRMEGFSCLASCAAFLPTYSRVGSSSR